MSTVAIKSVAPTPRRVNVITVEQLIAATNTDEKLMLFWVVPKIDAKACGPAANARFYPNKWMMDGVLKQGVFQFKDFVITKPIYAVGDKFAPKLPSHRLQLQSTRSQGGTLATFIERFEPVYFKKMQGYINDGTIVLTKTKKQVIHPLMQRDFKQEGSDKTTVIDDPLLRLAVVFEAPAYDKGGEPTTQFYDWKTRRLTLCADGKSAIPEYDLCTVLNEDGLKVPINADNVHKLITRGTIIRQGRCDMGTTTISQDWANIPLTAQKLWIEQGAGDVAADEAPIPIELLESDAEVSTTTNPTVPATLPADFDDISAKLAVLDAFGVHK